MRIILRMAMVTAGLFLFVNFLSAAENLVKNGDFETDINGWSGQRLVSGNPTPTPEFVSWETKDVKTGKGSLRIKITFKADEDKEISHGTGVVCELQEVVPDGSVLKVSFFARKISGPTFLSVNRPWGGGTRTVEISTDWKHYEVDLPLLYGTNTIMFSLVNEPADNFTYVAEGEFLLDDVVVEKKTTDVPVSK